MKKKQTFIYEDCTTVTDNIVKGNLGTAIEPTVNCIKL